MAAIQKVMTINYSEPESLAISDLTNTKWVLNDSPTAPLTEPEVYNLSFTSYGDDFIKFTLSIGRGNISIIEYGIVTVLNDEGTWTNQAYRTIEIAGGTDVTNADLIAWLSSNATQVIEPEPPTPGSGSITLGNLPISKIFFGSNEVSKVFLGSLEIYDEEPEPVITDLTNTVWRIKKPSELSKLPGMTFESDFYVSTKITYSNYVSNISTYLSFTPSPSTNGIIIIQYPTGSSGIYPRFTIVGLGGTNYYVSYIPSYTGTPTTLGDVECTLEITGGTDTTNQTLIDWLLANATQVNLISFTIGGISYTAEEGMTWYEWCQSDYNTSGWMCGDDSSNVRDNGGTYIVRYSGTNVVGSDTIIESASYTVLNDGGSPK